MHGRLQKTTGLLVALAIPVSVSGGEPGTRLARWFGIGWSEGYHTCEPAPRPLGSRLPPRGNVAHTLAPPTAIRGELVAPHWVEVIEAQQRPCLGERLHGRLSEGVLGRGLARFRGEDCCAGLEYYIPDYYIPGPGTSYGIVPTPRSGGYRSGNTEDDGSEPLGDSVLDDSDLETTSPSDLIPAAPKRADRPARQPRTEPPAAVEGSEETPPPERPEPEASDEESAEDSASVWPQPETSPDAGPQLTSAGGTENRGALSTAGRAAVTAPESPVARPIRLPKPDPRPTSDWNTP